MDVRESFISVRYWLILWCCCSTSSCSLSKHLSLNHKSQTDIYFKITLLIISSTIRCQAELWADVCKMLQQNMESHSEIRKSVFWLTEVFVSLYLWQSGLISSQPTNRNQRHLNQFLSPHVDDTSDCSSINSSNRAQPYNSSCYWNVSECKRLIRIIMFDSWFKSSHWILFRVLVRLVQQFRKYLTFDNFNFFWSMKNKVIFLKGKTILLKVQKVTQKHN